MQLSMMDELMSSQEDSLVNHTPTQENERERTTNATCGPRCCALFESVHHAGSWARTFAGLLVGMEGWSSKRCALTWKLVGTPYNRLYFQLRVSVHPTEENAYGLLPTVMSQTRERTEEECKDRQEKYGGQKRALYLDHLAAIRLLPTPTTKNMSGGAVQVNENGKRENKGGTEWSAQLHDLAKSQMLPTPTAFDWNTARSPEALAEAKAKYGSTLQDTLRQRAGQGFQLSPLYVEEMMGFPVNWTTLPFLDGEERASKRTEMQSSHK